MPLDAEICWKATTSRDRRFDGRFFIAVRTTRVYCRPGCPARLPARRNVHFFPSAAAAESAGYRPCRRCRPDAVPGSPAWVGAPAVVGRALRLIEAGALTAPEPGGDDGSRGAAERGVEALAARLGISGRRLRQLFAEHVGASPLQVAHTHRAHLARRLIEKTSLGLAEVALAAGFASARRLHAAVRATFRGALRELRDAARPAGNPGAARDSRLRLWLPARRPFDPAPLLSFLGRRAIPGVEAVDGGAYRRSFSLLGEVGTLEVRPGPCGVELELSATSPRALVPVAARVARLFDLDAAAAAIAAELRRDPGLRAVVPVSGVRVPGAWDPFELAVRALLGQQVSVAGARTLAGRLAERLGEPLPAALATAQLARVFPPAQSLARADLDGLGLTRARAGALRTLARAVAEGRLDLAAARSLDEAVAALEALPGFGAWTAHYVAMRALGEPDAFPAGDLGIRKALARAEGGPRAEATPPSERAVLLRAERWRPWRAYAAVALWSLCRLDGKDEAMRILRTATLESPVGRLALFCDGEELVALEFVDAAERLARLRAQLERALGPLEIVEATDPAGAVSRLARYFGGEIQALDEQPVKLHGTEFERKVWKALRRIPAGEVRSYAEIAAEVGAPRATRAVGAANGHNPIALFVPCHRVVASDGSLHGYGGGLDKKRWLLNHEKARARGGGQLRLAL